MAWQLVKQVREGLQPGPHLLITGGVHGDEFEPMMAVRQLIQELQPQTPLGRQLRGRVSLIPVVNEPAFRRGMRTADDGLDLARSCPGDAAGSMTQQIAAALTAEIGQADYYIDLHTGGTKLSVWPLTGYIQHPDPQLREPQRRMAEAFGLPLIWATDWRLNGRSLSAARDARVPAIYAEYLGGGRCEPAGVQAYARGCLNVMRELGNLPGPVQQLATEMILAEDDRPGAGHLQIQLPAPREGFFEPAVTLGQRVEQGATFGWVSDLLGEHREPVLVPHAGIVIVLHTFSRIGQGESLGVVLDANTIRPLT